jgi:hypothetical protein
MWKDEDMHEEPHKRTNTCWIYELWIFLCDEISEYEHKRIKYDSIWPEFNTLKPILYYFTCKTCFQIMLYRLPEISEKEYTNNIKMPRKNMM